MYDGESLERIHNLNSFTLASVYDFGDNLGGFAYGVLWEELDIPSDKGGVALLDENSSVIDFVSYGEVILAADGPAQGLTSVHILATITEPENSLQLVSDASSFFFLYVSTSFLRLVLALVQIN